jgi:hypothetical protein
VPGKRRSDGKWMGFKDWPKHQATVADCKQWILDGANGGQQGRLYPGLDIDVEDAKVAAFAEELAIKRFGDAPVRVRAGSSRRLLVYRQPKDGPPIRKMRLAWIDATGQKHAVELLGAGCQYLIFGTHKSGAEYEWRDGRSPCEWGGPASLNEATAPPEFFAELQAYVEAQGWTVDRGLRVSEESAIRQRKPLDHPSWERAPSHDQLEHILTTYLLNNHENFPSHDNDFVPMTAAIVVSTWPNHDDFYPRYEQWAMEYPGITEEYIRGRWDSIVLAGEAALDYAFILSKARAKGFSDAADPVPPEYLDTATPVQKMLDRFVWVSGARALQRHAQRWFLRKPRVQRCECPCGAVRRLG